MVGIESPAAPAERLRLSELDQAQRAWARTVRVPVVLRPAEGAHLRAIARGWGVGVATAGWVIIADRLGRLRRERPRWPADVAGALRLAGELALRAHLLDTRVGDRPLVPALAQALEPLVRQLRAALVRLEAPGADAAGPVVVRLEVHEARALVALVDAQAEIDELHERSSARRYGPSHARRDPRRGTKGAAL